MKLKGKPNVEADVKKAFRLLMAEMKADRAAVLAILNNPIADVMADAWEPEIADSYIIAKDWSAGIAVSVDEVYNYNGYNYRVIQAHTTQSNWQPDNVPALFAKIRKPYADWVQPTGAHDAYNTGDKVNYNGNAYISLIDANVWSPDAYPQGWEQL